MPDLGGRGGAALLALPFGRRKRPVLATEGTDPDSATSVENIRSADMRLVWSVAPPFFRSCGARSYSPFLPKGLPPGLHSGTASRLAKDAICSLPRRLMSLEI